MPDRLAQTMNTAFTHLSAGVLTVVLLVPSVPLNGAPFAPNLLTPAEKSAGSYVNSGRCFRSAHNGGTASRQPAHARRRRPPTASNGPFSHSWDSRPAGPPTDERFWTDPADPHWKHIAPVKMVCDPNQPGRGDSARRRRPPDVEPHPPQAHPAPPRPPRSISPTVCVSAAIRLYIGTGPARAGGHLCRQIFPGRAMAGERTPRLGLHAQRPDGAA